MPRDERGCTADSRVAVVDVVEASGLVDAADRLCGEPGLVRRGKFEWSFEGKAELLAHETVHDDGGFKVRGLQRAEIVDGAPEVRLCYNIPK